MGGLICAVGEIIFIVLNEFFIKDEILSTVAVTLILITVAAILTGFGIFDKIAKNAGAGTLVPVTGFSNAVVSEALDSSSEGIILGVGAKIFTVAGPVILFGLCSGVLYGIIYYLWGIVSPLI
jgi:stage V sporulation protein AC